jgi:hypothetical protein
MGCCANKKVNSACQARVIYAYNLDLRTLENDRINAKILAPEMEERRIKDLEEARKKEEREKIVEEENRRYVSANAFAFPQADATTRALANM